MTITVKIVFDVIVFDEIVVDEIVVDEIVFDEIVVDVTIIVGGLTGCCVTLTRTILLLAVS